MTRKLSFETQAKTRQSEFRESTHVSREAGTPNDDKGKRHRHLLALGAEGENLYPGIRERAVEFFRDRRIKWWRSARSGDIKGASGPTRNLASSQVACVNFLLPLEGDKEALTAMLRHIDSDVQGVEEILYDEPTSGTQLHSHVEFEWVGLKGSLEGGRVTRGAHCTSVDALLVARTGAGRRAYLFEWKYVESYPIGEDKGEGPEGDVRKARYRDLYVQGDSPFRAEVPMEELLFEPLYQIMRLGLLGAKMVREGELGADDYRVVVVCPAGNDGYRQRVTSPGLSGRFPNARTVDQVLKNVLKDPRTVTLACWSDLLAAVPPTPKLRDWSDYLRVRYGL